MGLKHRLDRIEGPAVCPHCGDPKPIRFICICYPVEYRRLEAFATPEERRRMDRIFRRLTRRAKAANVELPAVSARLDDPPAIAADPSDPPEVPTVPDLPEAERPAVVCGPRRRTAGGNPRRTPASAYQPPGGMY
jgi:hypothetical protein